MRRLLCALGFHRDVFRVGMPAVFKGDPDLFTVCKCRTCQRSWLEPPQ